MTERTGRKVTIRSKEVMGKGWASLTRYVVDVQRSDGTTHQLVREMEDHGDSVAVLPYDVERGTVLLTRQFRFAAHLAGHDGWLVEACAGMIDEGETPEQALLREAREELGVDVRDLRRLREVFVSPGASKERATLFSARYSPADRVAKGGGADAGEDIEVIEMTLADAAASVAGGGIVDAKTIILIQSALLSGDDA